MRSFFAYILFPSGIFDKLIRQYKLSALWEEKRNLVVSCPDFNKIDKVKNAGEIIKGRQVMHNGLLILLGSYYGPEYSKLLFVSKGMHEPQEQYAFSLVLKCIHDDAVMIELGSFWGFYSMWFQKEINNATNYLIEPDLFNINSGKRNFRLNKMRGDFTQAYIGSNSFVKGKVPVISVDDFSENKNIQFIDILHADIQGFEGEMLDGAHVVLSNQRIGYLFISTHNNKIHHDCIKKLRDYNYMILCEVDLDESYSVDGLIVAKNKSYSGISEISISKRN